MAKKTFFGAARICRLPTGRGLQTCMFTAYLSSDKKKTLKTMDEE